MTEQIEIGGKLRPVRFGWAGLLEYEQQTGRKALADFAEFGKALADFTEFGNAGGVSVTVMTDLVFYGLLCGHRTEKVAVEFDKYDVADWIGEQPEILERIMSTFTKSFPDEEGNAKAGKPKATPRKATPIQ